MKKVVRIYKKDISECLEEAKQMLNKRYATQQVKMLTLKLWKDSSELVEMEVC